MLEELKTYLLKNKYRLLLAAILLAALWMRLRTLFAPMQYDEIWSLDYVENSIGKILTDLATPNNHPVNTLFVKLWREYFDTPQLIRLHSLIFGMLSVVLTGALALGLFRSRAAALFSMLFMAFDGAAVYYSGLARGYSTQLFFLLCFACGIVWSGRLRRFLPWKHLPEAAMIVGAAGAVLSVPTAPIFLAAIVIAARIYHRKLPTPAMYIAIGIAGLLVATYLGINKAALQEAQSKFGRDTGSFRWEVFLLELVFCYLTWATAPFLLAVAATDRKRSLLLFFCAALIVGSAAFTRPGPSRVYLPLCVLVALGCGRGANSLLTAALCYNNRKLVAILAVSTLLLAWFGNTQVQDIWHVTDYWSWFEAGRSMPAEHLVVYPATEGLPLTANNDQKIFLEDQLKRFSAAGFSERKLLCFKVEPGKINGMDSAKREVVLPVGVPGTPKELNGFPAVEYRLVPTASPLPGEAFVAILFSADAEEKLKKAKYELLRLNPWFPVQTMVFGRMPDTEVAREAIRNCGAAIYTFAAPEAAGRR